MVASMGNARVFRYAILKTHVPGLKHGQVHEGPIVATLDLSSAIDPYIPKNLIAELGPYGNHIQQSVYG